MWKSKETSVDASDPNREWRLLESVFRDAFAEQKRARRWSVVFKLLTFAYLFGFGLLFYFSTRNVELGAKASEHVGVVSISGVIGADEAASAARIGAGLRKAFENESARAVIVAINSPGGSPVQAGYIYDEMKRLKALYPTKKLYAVIADIGASGGYYVAAAADEIYADKASLVGSIGVTASGFGFVDALAKLGVERRTYTAGAHKAFLDPFSPVNEQQKHFWQDVLKQTHEQFISAVQAGRGDRLTITEEIASGLVWNGEQALALGLVDGLGSVRQVARDLLGSDELHDYTPRKSPLNELLGELGLAIGQGAAKSIAHDAHLIMR